MEGGIQFDPRRIDGIKNISSPTDDAQLQHIVCAMQWMRSGIPNFSSVTGPLNVLPQRVYKLSGKGTRLAAGRVLPPTAPWDETHDKGFLNCSLALENQATLSHLDTLKRICVFTHASDFLRAGVITQIPVLHFSLPFQKQCHALIAFLSRHSKDNQLGWSTLGKEAYAIMATVMHWDLA